MYWELLITFEIVLPWFTYLYWPYNFFAPDAAGRFTGVTIWCNYRPSIRFMNI
jgi:hypothetical protein